MFKRSAYPTKLGTANDCIFQGSFETESAPERRMDVEAAFFIRAARMWVAVRWLKLIGILITRRII